LLLLAVAGLTMARESTIGPCWNSQTESNVQDFTTTPGEPTATTTAEPTDTADEETTGGSEPDEGSVIEKSTEPEADEPEITEVPEVTEVQAPVGQGEKVGRPGGVGKGQGLGGKTENRAQANDVGEANRGQAQEKVIVCHKDKKTLSIGAPAQPAHLRHGDTVGPCPEGAVTGPPEEKPGQGVAQNGEGGSGNGQQKVALCHKGKTLAVPGPAADAHLRHGGSPGAC